MITSYIGQAGAVATLNEVLAAHKKTMEKKEKYAFRPVNLGGYTGTGKSNLARVFAAQLEHVGFNYLEVTPKAGMRDLYEVFGKIKSEDDNGNISAIPHVIFWDELQSQSSSTFDLLKALTTKVEECHTITRQGFNFHFDPTNHIHIFASNRAIDKAMERRCLNVKLTTYTPAEMQRLAEMMLTKKHGVHLSDAAMQILLSRTKPLAGDLEELVSPIVNRAKATGKNKLDADAITDVLKKQGYFPKGLRRPDMAIVNQLINGAATSAVLKFKCQDDKKKDTQERVDWLCSLGLVDPVRGGFSLSKLGVKYAEEIIAAQKASKAAKTPAKPAK